MAKSKRYSNLIPYNTIVKASSGDILAINEVLKHYEGYIKELSTREMYDENGKLHYFVDETLRQRMGTKLITRILKFKVA